MDISLQFTPIQSPGGSPVCDRRKKRVEGAARLNFFLYSMIGGRKNLVSNTQNYESHDLSNSGALSYSWI